VVCPREVSSAAEVQWLASPRARRVEDQSLRYWKKVRAKVRMSPQIETSLSERTEGRRAAGAAESKRARRVAAKLNGAA